MPSTNFVVSSLPSYVQENRDLLLKNFGLVGTATRRRISVQTGIKKSAYLNYLDIAPTLQSGEGCGFSAAGTATLTQRTISVARIKVNMDVCPDSLVGKYAEYLVRINANPGDLPFEQYIMDGLVAELNKKIETLIWQGDTTLTTNTDLKWIDGLVKQLGADSSSVKVSIAAGTSAYNSILAVYNAIPEEALERGALVFVSPAMYREFLQDMVAKNYFHYSGPQDAAPEEFVFPGTDVRVVKTPGLAGTQKLVATWGDNLVYGTDMEGDWEDIKVWFSDDDDVYKIAAKWATGIAYKFPNQIVIGTRATS